MSNIRLVISIAKDFYHNEAAWMMLFRKVFGDYSELLTPMTIHRAIDSVHTPSTGSNNQLTSMTKLILSMSSCGLV